MSKVTTFRKLELQKIEPLKWSQLLETFLCAAHTYPFPLYSVHAPSLPGWSSVGWVFGIRVWDSLRHSELSKSPVVFKNYFIKRLKPSLQLGHYFMVNSVWSQNNTLKNSDIQFLNKFEICSTYSNLFELPKIGRRYEIIFFKKIKFLLFMCGVVGGYRNEFHLSNLI